jgi:putative hemolysin
MDIALAIIMITTALIFSNGLYVAAELSSLHIRRSRISQQSMAGNRFARLFETIISDPSRFNTYVAGCRVGITLSSLLLGWYGEKVIAPSIYPFLVNPGGMHSYVAYGMATVIVLLLLTTMQMVMGEIVPRALALHYTEETTFFAIIPMRWSIAFFRPAIVLFNNTAALLLRMFRIPPMMHRYIHSPEEIEHLATESAEQGLIEADEHQLLHNVFRAAALTSARIMVPRTRLVAASEETCLLELLELISSCGHTRIPLYQDSIDTIVGSVHLKDLFRLSMNEKNVAVAEIARPVSYVSETQPALSVWNQLRQESNYIAIVQDEFGGTAGMITVGDLLEELFGELQDEFDTESSQMVPDHSGFIRLQGDVRIDDINEQFDVKLPEEEVNTLGGLMMASLGRLPQVGDELSFDEVTLRVEAVNGPSDFEVCLIFAEK